ncbi:protein piccolo [Echria macrotheca]|uniref:Protein piccolo n=1 Tax=Echria macrotheca TaxID=438768 RepID=A0AAJ0BMH3_9PEZI|nr:protein piccolo [Echria macrotheca]
MNLPQPGQEHVEPQQPYPPLVAHPRPTSSEPGQSEARTLVPHAPSPPCLPPRLSSSSSEPELYGPDRLFAPAQVARVYSRPVVVENPLRRIPDLPLSPPSYPPNWQPTFNPAAMAEFRDELARLEGVVTPGVDDTPYIQYAIEALTRGDRDTGYSAGEASSTNGGTPVPIIFPGLPQGYPAQPQQPSYGPAPIPLPVPVPGAVPFPSPTPYPIQPGAAKLPRGSTYYDQQPPTTLEPPRPDPRASADSLASSLKQGQRLTQAHEWMPVSRQHIVSKVSEHKAAGVPALNFKPTALRTPALLGLIALSLVMIALLMLAAIYSELHRGLLPYEGTYGSQYFLFRVLPPLVGAILLLYAQFIVTTMFRILPFVGLASDRREDREGALFQDLYPTSFLWPRLVGSWQTWVPILITWLMNLTVPLQNSLFTVILHDGVWVWATVQGVAWTLVAFYIVLAASTVVVWSYWAKLDNTGLIWDPRSIADVTAIISDTNTAEDYHGTQLAKTRDGIRFALRRRTSDRLGYWTWKDGRPGFWYTLGSPLDNLNTLPLGRDQLVGKQMAKNEEAPGPDGRLSGDHDIEGGPWVQGRDRYLPWCLRSSQLALFVIAMVVLIAAILVVSFNPVTNIGNGFLPQLDAAPTLSAFSAANFLYSFLPSLLGMILFLLFQSLDMNLRILQPWASLSDARGARAEQSLLVDYAACAPLQVTLRALRNRHWKVAITSLHSTLFILIPVLAGAIFMALTPRNGVVRMYPNMPVFTATIALLVVYLFSIVALFPGRRALRMPHAVTCLAEIIGYLANEDVLGDLSFKQCRSRAEMLSKMRVGMGLPETQTRWTFGVATEGGEEVLGVRKARRFTEKRVVRKSQIRRRAMV